MKKAEIKNLLDYNILRCVQRQNQVQADVMYDYYACEMVFDHLRTFLLTMGVKLFKEYLKGFNPVAWLYEFSYGYVMLTDTHKENLYNLIERLKDLVK